MNVGKHEAVGGFQQGASNRFLMRPEMQTRTRWAAAALMVKKLAPNCLSNQLDLIDGLFVFVFFKKLFKWYLSGPFDMHLLQSWIKNLFAEGKGSIMRQMESLQLPRKGKLFNREYQEIARHTTPASHWFCFVGERCTMPSVCSCILKHRAGWKEQKPKNATKKGFRQFWNPPLQPAVFTHCTFTIRPDGQFVKH